MKNQTAQTIAIIFVLIHTCDLAMQSLHFKDSNGVAFTLKSRKAACILQCETLKPFEDFPGEIDFTDTCRPFCTKRLINKLARAIRKKNRAEPIKKNLLMTINSLN